jgi:hypothetical protein
VRKIPICQTLDYYLATCYNYIIVKMKGEHYTMKNIQSIVAAVKGKVFKLSGEKINQVERNSFKNEILAALVSDLQGIGGIYRTNDGVILEVSNDELGVIHLEFDVKVKNTDFDVTSASDEYQQTITARVERVQDAAKRKAERLAKSSKK